MTRELEITSWIEKYNQIVFVSLCVTELDGNDLMSYWPALEECDTHTLQKWGSERPLGADYSKDAANNNQLDAALTSGDESGLTQPHRHRKGEEHQKIRKQIHNPVFMCV